MRSRTRGVLLAVLASFLWGTVPVAGRVALGGISAPALSTLRLLTGGLALALLLRLRGAGAALARPPPLLLYLAAAGLAANYLGFMWSVEWSGAATAHVLIQSAPLFLLLLSLWIFRERLRPIQAAGAALAFAGVALVSGAPAPAFAISPSAGVLAGLGAAFTWALYAVAQKRLGADRASGPTMAWILVLAAVWTLPVSILRPAIVEGSAGPRSADAVEVAFIAYLCVNTVGAYWSFAESLRHVQASLVAVITTLGPVVSFSLLALADALDWSRLPPEGLGPAKIGGAAMVVAGVSAAVLRPGRRRPRDA